MRVKVAFIFLAALLIMPATALGQSNERTQQEIACQDDAYRLCPDEIPDESRVYHCMSRQKTKLSPACRAMFGPSPRRH